MRSVIYLMSCALLFDLPLTAKHWHENQKHWDKHSKEADDDDRHVNHHADSCYFQPHDTRVITTYYAANSRPLPPGLQKKLYRTGHLPPGWDRRIQPLPVVVERQLAPVTIEVATAIAAGYGCQLPFHNNGQRLDSSISSGRQMAGAIELILQAGGQG